MPPERDMSGHVQSYVPRKKMSYIPPQVQDVSICQPPKLSWIHSLSIIYIYIYIYIYTYIYIIILYINI